MYSALVEKDVKLAMLYMLWLDQDNFTKVTKEMYGKHYPWPLHHILMWQRQYKVRNYIKSQHHGTLVDKATVWLHFL